MHVPPARAPGCTPARVAPTKLASTELPSPLLPAALLPTSSLRLGTLLLGPCWGWYFTAVVLGSTLVYTSTLPENLDCEKVQDGNETLYLCDGVLYRSIYYKDEKVYEIVSDQEGAAAPVEPTSVIGLLLTSPMTKGLVVRDFQNRLVALGYDVGGVDGVFGVGTETALEWIRKTMRWR